MQMAAELVTNATSEKLSEMDWSKNIEICELVARDHRQAKVVVKAIKKRLGSKNANTQLYSVLLLEMLLNNVGEPVHRQVVDKGVLPVLVKIVKKKTDLPVREKIFLLLDAAQTNTGGASGMFPQFYSAFYELVRAGVQFPQRPTDISKPDSTDCNGKHTPPAVKPDAPAYERNSPQAQNATISESSILEKAGTASEVLRDVLDAVDSQNPEGAKDEFTLDLVEQCSFHKQRVMQLAVTSRNEKIVLQAVEINEHLDRVLHRHSALLSCRMIPESNDLHHGGEVEEEEEAEQLFRRMRKGKACIRPEDEVNEMDCRPLGLTGLTVPGEIFNRPLIRPLSDHHREKSPLPMEPNHKTANPFGPHLNQKVLVDKQAAVIIPPPPSKYVEREKFFQDNKPDDTALKGHLRSLSLHSGNVSSSQSGSTNFSD